jgi:hypothetical protein
MQESEEENYEQESFETYETYETKKLSEFDNKILKDINENGTDLLVEFEKSLFEETKCKFKIKLEREDFYNTRPFVFVDQDNIKNQTFGEFINDSKQNFLSQIQNNKDLREIIQENSEKRKDKTITLHLMSHSTSNMGAYVNNSNGELHFPWGSKNIYNFDLRENSMHEFTHMLEVHKKIKRPNLDQKVANHAVNVIEKIRDREGKNIPKEDRLYDSRSREDEVFIAIDEMIANYIGEKYKQKKFPFRDVTFLEKLSEEEKNVFMYYLSEYAEHSPCIKKVFDEFCNKTHFNVADIKPIAQEKMNEEEVRAIIKQQKEAENKELKIVEGEDFDFFEKREGKQDNLESRQTSSFVEKYFPNRTHNNQELSNLENYNLTHKMQR